MKNILCLIVALFLMISCKSVMLKMDREVEFSEYNNLDEPRKGWENGIIYPPLE